jgi:hypothetical protein
MKAEVSWCNDGLAGTWPLDARAQQAERVRRIGALIGASADDPDGRCAFGVRAGAAGTGLSRRPQRPDRRALTACQALS